MSNERRSPIVMFLSGSGPDGAGRMLDDVLAFSDAELERHHDFIQWLFPLPVPSSAVPGSPVLTRGDIAAIAASRVATTNVLRGLARMTEFYAGTRHWLVFHDHNHRRITRIITSTHLLLGPGPAQQFYDDILALVNAAGRPVSPVSLKFWRDAVEEADGAD